MNEDIYLQNKYAPIVRLGKVLTVLWVPLCLHLQSLGWRAIEMDAISTVMLMIVTNFFGGLLFALVGAIIGWIMDLEDGDAFGGGLFLGLYLWPIIIAELVMQKKITDAKKEVEEMDRVDRLLRQEGVIK